MILGIVVNQDSKAEALISGANQIGSYALFAADKGWGRSGFGVYPQGYVEFNSVYTNKASTNDNSVHSISLSANGYYVDNVLSFVPSITTFTSPSLTLFCLHRNATFVEKSSYRLHLFKLYASAVLVCDFVPCRRLSDGAIGMFDLVSQSFFGNSGTGSFIGGAPVLEPTWGSGLAQLTQKELLARRFEMMPRNLLLTAEDFARGQFVGDPDATLHIPYSPTKSTGAPEYSFEVP